MFGVVLLAADSPELSWWFLATPATLAIAAVVLVLGLTILALNWWWAGRDRVYVSYLHLSDQQREQVRPFFYKPTLVVEYDPPAGLRPAQMGVLLRESPDTRDFTATLADLCARGYLSIEELPSQNAWGGPAWRVRRLLTSDDGMQIYEQTLVDGLFTQGDDVVLGVATADYWLTIRRVHAELLEDAARSGLFAGNPERVMERWRYIGIGVIVVGIGLVPLLGAAFRIGYAALAVAAIGGLLILTRSWMPRRTAKGSELLRRCLGFKMYVDRAERSRHDFNERESIFADYLGYAIVFGSVDRWADAFKHVNTTDILRVWMPEQDQQAQKWGWIGSIFVP